MNTASGSAQHDRDAAAPVPGLLFSEATALSAFGATRFAGGLDSNWTVGGRPSGGYMLAMLGRAAAAVTVDRHVIAASAHYLRAPEAGPVAIDVELLRRGRSISQLRATMSQDDRVCVDALVLAERLGTTRPPFWQNASAAAGKVRWEDCERLGPILPDGTRVAIRDQIEVRLERDSSGFMHGRPSGRGELRGWLALPGDEPFDPTSLLFAVDAFPPATFDIEFSGWVPTLELTAYVRALPQPGPVRILQSADLIDAQRVDQSCCVWDCSGRLVAQARQLGGVRIQ